MAYTMKELAERLSAASNLATARQVTIEELTAEVRDLNEKLAYERGTTAKRSTDFMREVERRVNAEAERDALMRALVEAYKTRKP